MTLAYRSSHTVRPALFGLSVLAALLFAGCSSGSPAAGTPATPTQAATATPAFTPAAGTYNSVQSISLTDAAAGATIYYTTDGSTPTTASRVYSAPIAVTSSETINAFAVMSGAASAIVTEPYILALPTAPPVFTPAAGTYTSAQNVTLADTTPGATIYYTTDGTMPSTASKTYSAAIPVTATTSIQAIAVAANLPQSTVATAVYTINSQAATPTFAPAGGSFTSSQSVTLADASAGATIYYTTNGSIPTIASAVYSAPIAISATTTIQAIAAGTGYAASPAAAATYTINLSAGAPSFSPAAGTFTSAQSVTLSVTTPGATIYYTTNGTNPTTSSTVYSGPIAVNSTTTIEAFATTPGSASSPMSSALYTINSSAVAPTFNPAPGTFTSTQSVTMADATTGAKIYYTLDGSAPTTSSTPYSGPLSVSQNTTINAIATAPNYSASVVSNGFYSIQIPAAATPAISPAGGTFTTPPVVTLSDSAANATVYYTTNGSTPTTSSTQYTAPFTITSPGTTIVEALAVVSGTPNSNIASASYTLPAGTQPNYTFNNVQIVGGGFVDGLFFHPASQGLMYARTDVGGAYRWNSVAGGDKQWVPITDFVGRFDSGFNIGVDSLGLDPKDPTRVYLAVGEYTESFGTNGFILSSSDMGNTFTSYALPFKNGSNDNGRFAGERLSVDPANGRHIYFGTRLNGLYESNDQAASFHAVTAFPVTGATGTSIDPGVGVIFEDFLSTSGMANGNTKTVYVGVSDPTTGLYVSNDGGQTFSAVAGQPTGYYPNASSFDPSNRYLYISYGVQTNCTSGCNSVGPTGVNAGQIWRYSLPTTQTAAGTWTNITPPTTGNGGYGYSSIAVDAQHPDTVMTTTLNKYYPPPLDDVFRSLDDGATWVNYGTNIQRDPSLSPWITFGAATAGPGNWLNHLAIDPFNSNHVMYGDGQTVWQTTNATAVDGVTISTTAVNPGNATNWSIGAVGIEETVVTALASPQSGPANLISEVGDIGGFTHTTLTQSLNSQQNPLFTSGQAVDVAGQAPLNIARVGDISDPVQKEAFSSDGGQTWTPSSSLPINPATSAAITTGDGTIAVAADGSNLVWTPNDTGTPANYSTDHGATWHTSTGAPAQTSSNRTTVAADRVNPMKFYLFNSVNGTATVYVSVDGGMSFAMQSQLASQNDNGFFVSPAAEGDLWTTSSNGLSHSTDSGKTFTPVLGTGNVTYAMGFGAAAMGQTYPAIYMIGTLSSDSNCVASSNVSEGFSQATECIYRSTDGGKTFLRINDYKHQYGNANIITGDPRIFGRFYLGTAGRGIIYGDSPN
jgi:Chitobiase/beta-hexosaminidase C-terminal domain